MKSVTLLHGFCENKAIWDSVLHSLSDCDVTCMDLPGFGSNGRDVGSMDDMADDVVNKLNELNVDRTILIGHSMGGYVALNVLKRFPQRLKAIGLFHSTADADTEEKKDARNRAIEHVSTYGVDGYLKEMSNNLVWKDHPKSESLVHQIHRLISGEKAEGVINALRAMRDRRSSSELLSKTDLPVLMVAGLNDKFISWRDQIIQASQCQRSMIFLLKNSGHLGQLEEPEQSGEILADFVNWV